MASSAHHILFVAVTMALFFSACAYHQGKAKQNEPCKGGPMDVRKECGTYCPLTCEHPEPQACIRSCQIDVCQCEAGYYRRSDGMCTTLEDCKKVPPAKCST